MRLIQLYVLLLCIVIPNVRGDYTPQESCPAGYACPPGNTGPVICAAGTYAVAGASACTPCAGGSYSATAGRSVCTTCPGSAYCPGGGSAYVTCPAGYYCQGDGNSAPSPCPPSTWGYETGRWNIGCCLGCQAGSECPNYGMTQSIGCQPGTYTRGGGVGSEAHCVPCVGGAYCPTMYVYHPSACPAGTTSAAGASSSSACTPCPAGTYGSEYDLYDMQGIPICVACPASYYTSTTGRTSCTACPAGTYSSTTGGNGIASCLTCPTGSYCASGGQPVVCPIGKYSTAGASICTNCAAGSFANVTALSACYPCPVNTVQTAPGKSSCTACPSGTTSPTGTSSHCVCGAGYDPASVTSLNGAFFSFDTAGRVQSDEILPGIALYNASFGSHSSTESSCYSGKCLAGGVTSGANMFTVPTMQFAAGSGATIAFYRPNTGGDETNTFFDVMGWTAKTRYTDTPVEGVSSYMNLCNYCGRCVWSNYYWTHGGVGPIPLWAGYLTFVFLPGGGWRYFIDGVLKYNHVTNDPGISWACTTPATTGVSAMGWGGPYDDLVIMNQSLTDSQVASLYSSRDLSGAASVTCPNPCAADHYCPAGAGASDTAIPCPNHLFSYAGASTVDDCISPAHSLWGSSNAWTCENGYQYTVTAGALGGFLCTPCAAGSFCVDGAPTLCAATTYSPTTGASVCLTCPAGTYRGTTGATVCADCSAGTHSAAGAAACTDCSAGTHSAAGAPTCTDCSAGTYSASGAATCTDCSAGTYSAAGAVTCVNCAANTYSDTPGTITCTTCPDGTLSRTIGADSVSACLIHYPCVERNGGRRRRRS